MKDNRIRAAWDAVNPTSEQKRRMRSSLEAHMNGVTQPKRMRAETQEDLPLLDFTIPEDPYKKPTPQKEPVTKAMKAKPLYYSAPQRTSSRGGILTAVIAALLMLVTATSLFMLTMNGSYGLPHQAASPTASATETSIPDTTQAPDTGFPAYNEVLQKYLDAIYQDWPEERYYDADISAHIYRDNAQNALGWCLMDVDANGREELLISDGEVIYDGYTMEEDGELVHFLTANDNDQWQFCTDGSFYCFSMVDGKTFWVFCYLEDGFSLHPYYTVTYDHTENAYYAAREGSQGSRISKDEAGEIIVGLHPRRVIPVTLFQSGENGLPAEYQEIIDKYTRAINENWDGARLSQEDMSLLVRDVPGLNELGYALMDLDRDGFTELIITDGYRIYDLYTRFQSTDRMLTHVLTGWERLSYYLSEGNTIAGIGSNSAYSGEYRFSRLEGGAECLIERLEYAYTQDAGKEAVANWTHYGPGNLINQVSVTETEANDIIAQYPRIFIPHTTLSGEKWSTEYSADANLLALYAENIPYAYENYGKAEEKTFCFHDIDDDGREELLLGGGNTIYRILQPRTGNEGFIDISAPTGDSGYAYLCEGNVIQCVAFAQGNNHYKFIKIGDADGTMETETVAYVFYSPETESWYEGGPGINTPIFEESAQEVFDTYPQVELNWKPISQFPVPIGEIGISGTPLFEQVFMQVATGEVSNRLEDITALIEELGFTWRMDEGVIECIDHNAQHGTLIAYLTNQNGYEEVFDLTYVNKYGENEEDCRKATVNQLAGKERAYYIGTDPVSYVGAKIEDPDDFRRFVFGDDTRLMLQALATQFLVALSSDDEIYLRQYVTSDFGPLDLYEDFFVNYQDIGEIKVLPSEGTWDGDTLSVSVACIVQPDTDSYSYLTLEFVKENGLWKVSFYGLEK